LISANSVVTEPPSQPDAIQKAESAALRLLETLGSLRSSFGNADTAKKRKHAAISSSDAVPAIWSKIHVQETAVKKQRNSILNLWANKTRATQNVIHQSRLNTSSDHQSLSDVLTSQLADMSRLVAKTEVPRSCAPLHAKDPSVAPRPALPIYDDADFYGILLQTLVSQRSSDISINSSLAMQPWQVARETKTRKAVDTKASKGRRLRYTVHEKLQDSMAREDRTTWTTRQCDELFASLLGRTIQLKDDIGSDNDVEEGFDGLRLFANR
jgi:protein AATF/BFR2